MERLCYRSTRGEKGNIVSSEAILNGIAGDGGLYVPSIIPWIGMHDKEIAEVYKEDIGYKQLALEILGLYFIDFSRNELRDCIDKAYDSKFDTEEIAPLRKFGSEYYLELHHGPTLAFKDLALSILPHLMTTASRKLGIQKDIVILTATSGDTGKAALEGFSEVEGVKVIVFFPKNGTSEIQRKQMTAHDKVNGFACGVDGNFDDAQSGVKAVFTDKEFIKALEQNNYMMSSANSINIGRLFPQVVYYFYAYLRLLGSGEINYGDSINVAVPTGNFGDILAAYYAREMGLPIKKLICASNENNVLYDFLKTGRYDIQRRFVTTISPSMDILVSSNLERLLYLISSGNSIQTNEFMKQLKVTGKYEITRGMLDNLGCFYGGYADDIETRSTIKQVFNSCGYLIDPHTAVAYRVYRKYVEESGDSTKTIIVSTASPYKFTPAVMTSLDERYTGMDAFKLIDEMSRVSGTKIPDAIRGIQNKADIHTVVCSRTEIKKTIINILGI